MLCIYNYIPERNRVSRLCSVAAVLYLQFVLYVMLFRTLNMFCASTSALSAVSVQCPIWLVLAVPWYRASPVCCSGTVWVILRWFQSPLLLLIYYYYYYYYYYILMDDKHISYSHSLFCFFPVVSLHLEVFQYIPKPFCLGSSHSSLSFRIQFWLTKRKTHYTIIGDLRSTAIKVRTSCAVPSVCSCAPFVWPHQPQFLPGCW